MTGDVLVILGSTQTALAVVRNAHKLGIKPIVFDTIDGVATKSSLAESIIVTKSSSLELMKHLREIAITTVNSIYLVATSDIWLEFIINYRNDLEAVYNKIFHPSNDSLSICLEKQKFSQWCKSNDIPAPKTYTTEELNDEAKIIKFPLFIRPAKTRHMDSATKVPKALDIRDEKELEKWLDYFATEGVEALITESLLDQNLVQYSVAAVCANNRCISFVAVKRRPTADACAVGTYMELSENQQVKEIGIRTLELLDYFGIAEVEILHSIDTGANYVIEVNARPWIQYALGIAAGYDFLKFLIQPNDFDMCKITQSGKYWIDFGSDLYICFSKSSGLVRYKKISMLDYIFSLVRANVYAKFSITDIKPFLFELKELVKMVLSRLSR